MRLEKGEISSSQLMFLVAGFIQGTNLAGAFVVDIAKQDIWLVILSGLAISILFALVCISLALKFPDKNLMEINDIIYGPYLGKLISVLYIWFFLSLIFLNLRFISDFLLIYIMPETPIEAIMIMFIFVCAWAVRSGIEVIARSSVIFVVIITAIVFTTFVLLLKDMDITNFLPVFELTPKAFIQGTHITAIISFSEILVFLMVVPFSNRVKQVKKSILLGLIIGGVTLLIVDIQDWAVLGATSTIMASPFFEAVRLINIGNIFTKLEILVAIVLIIAIFLKICVLYHATVLSISQVLKLRTYVPLVIPVGIISICLAILAFNSDMEHAYWGSEIAATYSLPFEYLIPLVTLLVAKIRGIPERRREK